MRRAAVGEDGEVLAVLEVALGEIGVELEGGEEVNDDGVGCGRWSTAPVATLPSPTRASASGAGAASAESAVSGVVAESCRTRAA